jgi:NhaA family Na+:H+ antiporter
MEQILETLHFFTADGLLVVFFFVLGLELIEELRNGDLRSPKTAALPALAAFGGVLAPSLIFFGLVHLLGVGQFQNGWAIPTATDVAFSLLALSFIAKLTKKKLKSGVRLFVLVLAVVDDIIGIFIIAFAYSGDISGPALLGVVVCLLIWAFLLRKNDVAKLKILKFGVLPVIAIVTWFLMWKSGIHPTIAGVLLGVLVPTKRHRVPGSDGKQHIESLAKMLSEKFSGFCNFFVVPFFALVSIVVAGFSMYEGFVGTSEQTPIKHPMGVVNDMGALTTLTAIVTIALVVGKPLGILIFAWIGQHLTPLTLFHGLRVRDLIGAACLCGIGFTVSILIAGLSFDVPLDTAYATIGVLAGSALSVVVGSIVTAVRS